MPEPTSKAELIEAMISARNKLETLVEQIQRSTMTIPIAPGKWSIKDIIAHITSYDRWLVLTLALRGQKPPDCWIEDIPLDEFNRRLFEANRDMALDEVLRQFNEIWKNILEETYARTDAYLFTEQSIQGVPYKFKPCDMLKSESYGHYLDHIQTVRAWLETAKNL